MEIGESSKRKEVSTSSEPGEEGDKKQRMDEEAPGWAALLMTKFTAVENNTTAIMTTVNSLKADVSAIHEKVEKVDERCNAIEERNFE